MNEHSDILGYCKHEVLFTNGIFAYGLSQRWTLTAINPKAPRIARKIITAYPVARFGSTPFSRKLSKAGQGSKATTINPIKTRATFSSLSIQHSTITRGH